VTELEGELLEEDGRTPFGASFDLALLTKFFCSAHRDLGSFVPDLTSEKGAQPLRLGLGAGDFEYVTQDRGQGSSPRVVGRQRTEHVEHLAKDRERIARVCGSTHNATTARRARWGGLTQESALSDRTSVLHFPIRFAWDPAKAQANLQKHGVSFAEAATIFGDPFAAFISDDEHPERTRVVGRSIAGRLLFTVYAEIHEDEVRIISARRATTHERRRYEDHEEA
jgi:uncharacterized DUF497 family protein